MTVLETESESTLFIICKEHCSLSKHIYITHVIQIMQNFNQIFRQIPKLAVKIKFFKENHIH